MFRIYFIHRSFFSYFTYKSFHTYRFLLSTSPSLTFDNTFSTKENNKNPHVHYEGGDFNRAELLGTVIGISISPLVKAPEREWARLFVKTLISRPLLENDKIESQNSLQFKSSSDSHRVHVFNKRLMNLAHRIRIGDRVFISGFVSYYVPSETENRNLALVAEKIILMSSVLDENNVLD